MYYNSDSIKYIGVNDHILDYFEGQYDVPNGMAYNSYIIIDEKIAVTDTVDKKFGDEWLNNIEKCLGKRSPDYLIVHHMEPDHSANIIRFIEKYPDAKIAASDKAFLMMKKFYSLDLGDKKISLSKDGDTLSLGHHELRCVTAPMVHWPEVIMTYDTKEKVVFSADAFGKFGALDTDEDWACEARRYYFGIVGKYGAQVQAVLKKLAQLDIKAILPLHGPALTENLDYYLDLYNKWSTYTPETSGVAIAYTSVYGHTADAAKKLAEMLEKKGIKTEILDLVRDDPAEAVENAFRYDRSVFATTTYNMDIFPPMRTFIEALKERGFKNRKVAFIENGSWAPNATKIMKSLLEDCKDLEYFENNVKIESSLNELSYKSLCDLAEELSR